MAFRLLRADEIEARVASVTEKGCSLLLYKDARTDQNILDETFGMFGWQRSHQLIGDRLYCTVSIRDPETGEWISKQDVGTESYTEPEKGQASDSFKRACFNFGIGRELYTAPFIWIQAGSCTIKSGKNGKPAVYDRFRVKSIGYQDGVISSLVITNESMKGKEVFTYGVSPGKTTVNLNDPISDDKLLQLKICLKKHEMPEGVILERYGRKSLEDLRNSDWKKFIEEGQRLLDAWDEQRKRKPA